ncbi:MAG: Nif11-like leader peptide family natural product precursor [Cyanobacteria bacterium P01_A01_bin.84]
MSKLAVLQLIEAAESNPELLQRLETAKGPEAILSVASELGYEFSESELLDVMQEKQLSFTGSELSEEQLEAVVGGKGGDKSKTTSYSQEKSPTKVKMS